MRTIKLCAATTKRPTTLLVAIDRSMAEIARSGRIRRPIADPNRTSAPA